MSKTPCCGPDDSVGLFSLANRLTTLQTFTTDRNAVASAVLGTRAEGATALYDSLAQLSGELSKTGGKKSILLFTDGGDNRSVISLERSAARLRRLGIPVYTVAHDVQDRAALTRLQNIAADTNGIAFEVRNPAELRDVFRKVAEDLQYLYLLGYYPTTSANSSDWHRITIRLPHYPDLKVRAKGGYCR